MGSQSPLKSPPADSADAAPWPHGTIYIPMAARTKSERETLLFLAKLNGRPYFLLVQTFRGKTFSALRAAPPLMITSSGSGLRASIYMDIDIVSISINAIDRSAAGQ